MVSESIVKFQEKDAVSTYEEDEKNEQGITLARCFKGVIEKGRFWLKDHKKQHNVNPIMHDPGAHEIYVQEIYPNV